MKPLTENWNTDHKTARSANVINGNPIAEQASQAGGQCSWGNVPWPMKLWWSHKYQPFNISSPTLISPSPMDKLLVRFKNAYAGMCNRHRELWLFWFEFVRFPGYFHPGAGSAHPKQLSLVTSRDWASYPLLSHVKGTRTIWRTQRGAQDQKTDS